MRTPRVHYIPPDERVTDLYGLACGSGGTLWAIRKGGAGRREFVNAEGDVWEASGDPEDVTCKRCIRCINAGS